MLKKTLPVVVVTAVMCVGGVASASAHWTKSGNGSGYGKGKTLSAPTGASLSCVFGSPTSGKNNWTLNWTSNAATGESQTVTPSNSTAQSGLSATTHTATWTTSAAQGNVTASVVTQVSNWTSSASSSSKNVTASSGHCS